MGIKDQQLEILFSLLSKAKQTDYGREHGFEQIQSYPDFSERVPISIYKDIEEYIPAMKEGKRDLLWPGKIDRFAVSAGTTGEGKHLPFSKERQRSDRRFMRRVARSYLDRLSRIPPVMGSHLSLPGSVERTGRVQIGEISGFSALNAPWWLRLLQVENPKELTQLSFKEKFETVLESALNSDIKVIIAVPSWILTLFQQALERTGKETVSDVWPNLKLLVCGGVKLANYRPHLEKLYGKPKLDFIETYGASEGYFAYTDQLSRNDMKLVRDNGIFYEFIPDPLPDVESLSIQPAVPLWEVEPEQPYAMLVSTNAGLWRYAVKDIVRFSSVEPPRLEVIGRLNEMLDDFGEGLYLYEAEQALDESCTEFDLVRSAFTVGASIESEQEVPRHHWFVQFTEPVHPQTLDRLARNIDRKIQEINRHYAIRRESGTLDPPRIHPISQQDINSWFDLQEKGQAQSKLPKMLNDKDDITFFLEK